MNKLHIALLGVLFAIVSLFALAFTSQSAYAVSCSQAQCSVDSTAHSESNWREVANAGGSGGSSSGGGGSGSSNLVTYYQGCTAGWLPVGGGTSTSSYPAKNSGSYSCNFADGGAIHGDKGIVYFICNPRPDRAANGRLTVFYRDPKSHEETYAFYVCLYPTDEYAPIERLLGSGKVYTGGQGDFYSVSTAGGASQYSSDGLLASSSGYVSRGVNLASPEAYVGAWQPSFTASTAKRNGQPMYSYYRLKWTLDYRQCEKWAYPAWLGIPARYDCSKAGTERTASPYTYACNLNPPLQAGIISGAKFVPSSCNPSWTCQLQGNLTVNGLDKPFAVMRNGDPLKVTNPTPGLDAAPSTVANARNWTMKNVVKSGSTPFYGTNPNDPAQLFKSSWAWNAPIAYKPNGTIAFYWASDSASQPFSWSQTYGFTADWWLPVQDTIGGGVHYEWVQGSANCPQGASSPLITVVRAASG